MSTVKCCMTLSQANDKIKTLSSPSRNVLSPVNCNIKSRDKSSGIEDQTNLCLDAPKTPKTPFLPDGAENNNFEGTKTPLDRFHSRSSNFKVCRIINIIVSIYLFYFLFLVLFLLKEIGF